MVVFSAESPALAFEIVGKCSVSKARASKIHLPHATVHAPVFMPVGTQGTLKGITPAQLEGLGCEIMLGNTYHLGHRPGDGLLKKAGGLHPFMGWRRALLTDSGGFQMVSLAKLSRVTEEGVLFASPRDGSEMLLTPERSIELQNAIGADIIMQLDDVIHTLTTGPRVEEALDRTLRWLDRCIAAHARPTEQNLFPIIQGGTDLELRSRCITEMVKRKAPGYAIGGLSGGEDKAVFWRVVKHCTDRLPTDRPIYCMGVGYAVDLIVCVALGVDMFDCVFPTRTARFGTALVPWGNMHLRHSRYQGDLDPIDRDCKCFTCLNYSRAYLHAMVTKETVACHLLTLHNLSYQLNLMRSARTSIVEDRFPAFVKDFLERQFGTPDSAKYPTWIIEALASVNINL